MKRYLLRGVLLTVVASRFLCPPLPAAAQTPVPSGPIYIVQPLETLTSIAQRFNVSVDALMAANGITNPNLVAAGQRLVIPGLQGVSGILDAELINFGDSFRSLVRRTQISVDLLARLNHVVSPTEFYVGASMIVPKQEGTLDLANRLSPKGGQSLLELSLASGTDPWTLSELNGLSGTWDGLPGDVLYAPGGVTASTAPDAGGLPSAFVSVHIPTLPIRQGETVEIIVEPAAGVTVSGKLADYTLHFFPMDESRLVALQGVHAMLDPGVYPLLLEASGPDGITQSFEQMVLVASGGFRKEALTVAAELIDPSVADPENLVVARITAPVQEERTWQGSFTRPVYLPVGQPQGSCIYDGFGTRRSFNGGDYNAFHSGVDFGVCFAEHPLDIYAAAPGTVIYTGSLTVRGNATFIDHGWGVYTAYYHQSEINVSVGQQVKAGQLIGQIGQTGRVTGPHLHWEVWVNGIQVNPLDWINHVYP